MNLSVENFPIGNILFIIGYKLVGGGGGIFKGNINTIQKDIFPCPGIDKSVQFTIC